MKTISRRNALWMLAGVPLAAYAGAGCAGRPRPRPTPSSAPHSSPTPVVSSVPCTEPRAHLQFVVNVHDWVHYDESADTLIHCADLFDKYGVRGDFYLMGTMVQAYQRYRPDVIERLRDSEQSISYHVRPPHPLYSGFDARLRRLSDSALRQTLLDYETYALDLATGDLDRSQAGGYSLVAEALGRPPVTVTAPNGDHRIKSAAWEVYRSLGAQMGVFFHESGTAPGKPFDTREGLLARPSDFSVTRWRAASLSATRSDSDPFWWNMLMGGRAADYDPAAYFKAQVAVWPHDRPALVTSLIHENNFVRSGAESWTLSYFADTGKDKPLSPPFDLSARDSSKVRSGEEQERIWQAYEELIAVAAREYRVASSEQILELAARSGAAGAVAPACQ